MTKRNPLWVVYKSIIRGVPDGINAVCEQTEWEAMQLAKPGQQQLIQTGIANEGEAERLARGTSGDPLKRRSREETVALIPERPTPVKAEVGE
jgi:hypothetical protein